MLALQAALAPLGLLDLPAALVRRERPARLALRALRAQLGLQGHLVALQAQLAMLEEQGLRVQQVLLV